MAFSHLDASVVFPENGAGRAVLISDGFAVVVLGVWVDIEGLVMTGLVTGGTRVAGWTATGLYVGNDELEDRGVVARSRGLLLRLTISPELLFFLFALLSVCFH